MAKLLLRMRVVRVVLALALAACVEERSPGIDAESHVDVFERGGVLPWKQDLLFVVDDSTQMAPYVQRTRAMAQQLVDALSTVSPGMPDLHVGTVTAAGGPLVYLTDRQNVDGTRTPSFDGSLVDAIEAQLSVGANGTAPPRPLDAMGAVLDGPSAFRRDGAGLFVIIVSASDDTSAGAAADYAKPLLAPFFGTASAIYPRPAPRLDGFIAAVFGATYTSIDAPDYAHAFDVVQLEIDYGSPCIREPAVPEQCTIVRIDDDAGTEQQLLPCRTDSDRDCWLIRREAVECQLEDDLHAVVDVRGYLSPYRPHIRGECVI